MNYFFSVDWGTSSLRVRFIDLKNSNLIQSELTNHYGCAYVNDMYFKQKEKVPREDFYLAFLKQFLKIPKSIDSQESIPIIISGMASSSIGIKNIPYSSIPFSLNECNLKYEIIRENEKLNNDVYIISGLCEEKDVMRGEEVQLMGIIEQIKQKQDGVYILPGTHSKHIFVKNHHITSFKTYITGEIFQLITEHSLIKHDVTRSPSIDYNSFCKGVELSANNILNNIFNIRASSLIRQTDSNLNYSFLSGLIIGTELRDIANCKKQIFLAAHKNLVENYSFAMEVLSLQKRCEVIPVNEVDISVVHGQMAVVKQLQR